MAAEVYEVKLTFHSFRFSLDLVEPSATIYMVDDDGLTSPTQWQTVHIGPKTPYAAAMLLIVTDTEYWIDPASEVTEDDNGELLYDGMTDEEYVESQIISVQKVPGRMSEDEDDEDDQ